MGSFVEAQAARAFAVSNTPEERVKRNQCPVPTCNGDLDTGGECNDCGHDALALLVKPTLSEDLLRQAASLVYRIEASGPIDDERTNIERWKRDARTLAPELRAALATPATSA